MRNKKSKKVFGPNRDVVWDDCVLKPYETANLTNTVAPPPRGYQQAEIQPPEITKTSVNFCWVGGGLVFSVVNSAGVSASTRVTVRGVWRPILGGGGGPGPRPPNLYGSATGTARAQPGEYWNVADAPEVAVGNSVSVYAYKNDNEPAPSSWSISGPASIIIGAGAGPRPSPTIWHRRRLKPPSRASIWSAQVAEIPPRR